MALENLEPATRIEAILDGEDIAPATRLEYFLKQAAAGGGDGGGGIVEPIYTNGEPKTLSKTYAEILDYVEHGYRSVLQPIDGTGSTGYSVQEVVMLSEHEGVYTVIVLYYSPVGGVMHDIYSCTSENSYPVQQQ